MYYITVATHVISCFFFKLPQAFCYQFSLYYFLNINYLNFDCFHSENIFFSMFSFFNFLKRFFCHYSKLIFYPIFLPIVFLLCNLCVSFLLTNFPVILFKCCRISTSKQLFMKILKPKKMFVSLIPVWPKNFHKIFWNCLKISFIDPHSISIFKEF